MTYVPITRRYFIRRERAYDWSVYMTDFGCNITWVASFTTKRGAQAYINKRYPRDLFHD